VYNGEMSKLVLVYLHTQLQQLPSDSYCTTSFYSVNFLINP